MCEAEKEPVDAQAVSPPEKRPAGLEKPLQRLLCGRPGCSRKVPRQRRGGYPRRYCSVVCQQRDYHDTHPRVAMPRMSGETQCERILARLRQGDATIRDLRLASGAERMGARIRELRERGHRILGPKAWRATWGGTCAWFEARTTEPDAEGHPTYRLEE